MGGLGRAAGVAETGHLIFLGCVLKTEIEARWWVDIEVFGFGLLIIAA
jgi:hypothetical protein